MAEYTHIVHPFGPLIDENSQILILGSLPSIKTREAGFFYGHPQNRFWKVIAGLVQESVPETIEDKKKMLKRHHIALWDAIYSCDIRASSDASIKNVEPTNLLPLLEQAPITKVFCNGQTSYRYYHRYNEKLLGIQGQSLPSTSPANARYRLADLIEAWRDTGLSKGI